MFYLSEDIVKLHSDTNKSCSPWKLLELFSSNISTCWTNTPKNVFDCVMNITAIRNFHCFSFWWPTKVILMLAIRNQRCNSKNWLASSVAYMSAICPGQHSIVRLPLGIGWLKWTPEIQATDWRQNDFIELISSELHSKTNGNSIEFKRARYYHPFWSKSILIPTGLVFRFAFFPLKQETGCNSW